MKLIFCIFSVMFFAGCVYEKDTPTVSEDYVHVGDYLPKFIAQSTDHTKPVFNSNDIKQKVSMIVLFSSECGDCRRELPILEHVWKEFENDPKFTMAAISRDQKAEVISSYWQANSLTMPTYLDDGRTIFNKFATSTIPRIYLCDMSGKVVWMCVEKLEITADDIVAKIRSLLI